MASRGIKDRVAIIGMGCTKFGEHWDKGPEDLLVDAAYQAYESAGVEPNDVDAYWLGTMASGVSGLTLSEPLKIQYKPVTRVENMCATGSEALRQACYAVASGAFDMAMAIGVEKLKDSGYSGLVMNAPPNDGTEGSMTRARVLLAARARLLQEVRTRPRQGQGRPHAHRMEESQERREKSQGAVPEGSVARNHQELAQDCRPARHHGLFGRLRRRRRRHRRPRRGRA